MARTKQNPEFDIEVGGEPYVCRIQRQPQWSSDAAEWRGKAIAVRHKVGQREAVVEFPPGQQPRYGAPHLTAAQIAPELVARAITSAIAAGSAAVQRQDGADCGGRNGGLRA